MNFQFRSLEVLAKSVFLPSNPNPKLRAKVDKSGERKTKWEQVEKEVKKNNYNQET